MRPAVYLAPLVLGPVLLIFLALWIVPSPWYARSGADFWLASLGYGATLHGADCQIVVAGDSTAMVGVDPAELARLTHQSVCNVGEMYSVILESGNFVLDRYLAQNSRPRVLLFLLSPEGFNPLSKQNRSRRFEGITYRLRQPGLGDRVSLMVHRPVDFLRWVSAGLDGSLWHLWGPSVPEAEMTGRARSHGQFPLLDQHPYQCGLAGELIPPDREWTETLRTRYGQGGTHVLVDVMPVPACDPNRGPYEQMLHGLTDNELSTLPPALYFGGGRHVNAEGSRLLTRSLAGQILSLQSANGAS